MRTRETGDHARGRLPVVLRMRMLLHDPSTEAGQLLRILLVWYCSLSVHAGFARQVPFRATVKATGGLRRRELGSVLALLVRRVIRRRP